MTGSPEQTVYAVQLFYYDGDDKLTSHLLDKIFTTREKAVEYINTVYSNFKAAGGNTWWLCEWDYSQKINISQHVVLG
jgi:hypothetical protein